MCEEIAHLVSFVTSRLLNFSFERFFLQPDYDRSNDFPLAPPTPWDISANHTRWFNRTFTSGTWYALNLMLFLRIQQLNLLLFHFYQQDKSGCITRRKRDCIWLLGWSLHNEHRRWCCYTTEDWCFVGRSTTLLTWWKVDCFLQWYELYVTKELILFWVACTTICLHLLPLVSAVSLCCTICSSPLTHDLSLITQVVITCGYWIATIPPKCIESLPNHITTYPTHGGLATTRLSL